MPSLQHRPAARHRGDTGRRRPPDPGVSVVLVLCGLGLVLALIGAYVFRAEISSLIAWGTSPEPWWRP